MLESLEGGVGDRGWAQDSDDPATRDQPVSSQVWSLAWVNKHYDCSKRELSRKIRRQNAARCDLTWRRRKQDEEGGGGRMEPLHHTRERSYRAPTFSASNSTILIIILVFLFNFFEYTQGM